MGKDKIILWFANWTKIKIRLHLAKQILYFREREIWWAALGVNIGSEQSGKNENFERPVLILRKFNKEVFLGVPLTSKRKVNKYHFSLTGQSGITSYAILSQVRLMSGKRLLRKIDFAPDNIFIDLKVKLKELF